jgi:putative transposase
MLSGAMARFARVVVPDVPHHVTARGNRREPIFLEDGDQDVYCDSLAEQLRRASVEVLAYCLMPNHVHLILTPHDGAGMARALGEAHRRYAVFVNSRGRWTGHLFDGRYASAPMDEDHLLSAVRYVSLNPVRAGLAPRAQDWPWSSVRAHLRGEDDGLAVARPVLERVEDFATLIDAGADARHAQAIRALRAAERTGRPLGNEDFVRDLEARLKRPLAKRGPGRKPRLAPDPHPTLF